MPISRRVDAAIRTVPGCGRGLQAGGQVGRLARDRLLARRALADKAADHDQPGGDPDARRQGLARRRRQATDGLDGREPGPHRPLGLVLVRAAASRSRPARRRP